jgi:hypothetical protein
MKWKWLAVFVSLAACDPVQAQKDRTDRYGDPLPDGVIARLGTKRLYYGGYVNSAAISSDGSILIAAGRVCDGKTGKELPQFQGKYLGRTALFADDMKTVAVGHPDRIQRWDITSGKLLQETKWETARFNHRTAFTPDLKFVCVVEANYTTRVIATAPGKTLWEKDEFLIAAISPSGQILGVSRQ